MLKVFLKSIRNNIVITYEFLNGLLFSLPRYPLLNCLKKGLLMLMGAQIGKRPVFYPGVWINTGKNLVMGDDVDIAKNVLITTNGGVEIGDRTLVGYGTMIISSNHDIPPIGEPYPPSGTNYEKVTIGRDVWIGAGCIILPGVTIGEGATVSAGSIVTKDIPQNAIAMGIPAKVVKFRV